jgi:hypothetical protein
MCSRCRCQELKAAGWSAAASVTRGAVRYSAWFGDSGSVIGDMNSTEVCEMEERSARAVTSDAEMSVVSPADDNDGLVRDHEDVAAVFGKSAGGWKDRDVRAVACGSATTTPELNCLEGAVGRDNLLDVVITAKVWKHEPKDAAADGDEHNATAENRSEAMPERLCWLGFIHGRGEESPNSCIHR